MNHMYQIPVEKFTTRKLSITDTINECFERNKEVSTKTHAIIIYHNSDEFLEALGVPKEVSAFGIQSGIILSMHFRAEVIKNNFLSSDALVIFFMDKENTMSIVREHPDFTEERFTPELNRPPGIDKLAKVGDWLERQMQ
jgi:hypothetical protein